MTRQIVAIHNKNGKGLLLKIGDKLVLKTKSQSTIKMEKGYYHFRPERSVAPLSVAIHNKNGKGLLLDDETNGLEHNTVAIHNKNGKGLLHKRSAV